MSRLLQAMIAAVLALPVIAAGDEITQIVQKDLVTLGYEPGNTDGEATVDTIVAISKFQAEHDLDVTGEATPQLAGIVKATISRQEDGGGAATTAPTAPAARAAPAQEPLALQAAQQACLQQKMSDAQQSQKRKRGLARLARAITNTASEFGANEISSDIATLSSNVYAAGAIADDFKGAAEDLGLTESDIEACRNPS